MAISSCLAKYPFPVNALWELSTRSRQQSGNQHRRTAQGFSLSSAAYIPVLSQLAARPGTEQEHRVGPAQKERASACLAGSMEQK